jgi:hypothetical protein
MMDENYHKRRQMIRRRLKKRLCKLYLVIRHKRTAEEVEEMDIYG